MQVKRQIFIGTFIHSSSLTKLEYLHNTAIAVSSDGIIVAIEPECDASKAKSLLVPKLGWDSGPVSVEILDISSQNSKFFFPGFIDTHLHASQYPNVGIFGSSTLLDWLNTYTFPLEASLADTQKAKRVYTRVIRKTLSHGTTTAAYYATISVPSTNLLADLCVSAGQRALVGRVCMDQLGPDNYLDESPEQSLAATKECIEHIASLNQSLVRPVITPRFAPACSLPLLRKLGDLARETALPVQTHISENRNEIKLVKELFPTSATGARDDSYAGVYDAAGLLNDKMILAHAVHLTESEADLISARKAKVSHCPCSNSAITSGAAKVRWLLEKGIVTGLGTDMSGGYSPSVLEAARHAVLVSRHVAMDGDEKAKLSVEEVLYLATRGGAEVVGLEKKVGGFEVGMEWDAQLVGLGVVDEDGEEEGSEGEEGNVDVFGWETWPEKVAKWVYNGDDRNTRKVWVRGRLVHERK
ncbi:Metallo-dependent hydrolase [Cladorrhinum samala]|uniref:Probable guanine deaminase n=1 Tax=Cladorrhinum samala TaxID=585594 RepID=A0AAV9H8Y4_9PEZI|nr:Metallo-dependent hydrolase [Cladorrhinum samala]